MIEASVTFDSIELISKSNSFQVHRGKNVSNGQELILKVAYTNSPDKIAILRNEYNILQKASGPCVRRALQLTHYRECPCIVLEYVEAEN